MRKTHYTKSVKFALRGLQQMFRRGWLILASLLLVIGAVAAHRPVFAQGAPLVAFVNSSGQLIVSSGDGGYRWILTNPGEALVSGLGYAWSPDGGRVFFAVGSPGDASLRVGDVNSQGVYEIGRAGGALSGGVWLPNGYGVLVADGSVIRLYPADGSGAQDVVSGAALISPFANDRPQLPSASSISPDSRFVFYWQGSGSYAIQAIDGSGLSFGLPGTNDAYARQSGLWSNAAPLVAYWGYNGSAVLSVTDASNGQTITLDSGRTAPINPLAWFPGTSHLVYRDASSTVKIADVSCVSGGCGGNPLQAGATLMPGSASDVQFVNDWGFYLDGEAVKAIHISCLSGDCINSAVTLGGQAAPQTIMDVGGGLLVYTAYTSDPYNGADREVRVVNLGCLGNPSSCGAQTVMGGAVAGMLSSDGSFVTVEQVGGGLNSLRLYDRQLTYLSDSAGYSLLATARWR